MTLSPLAQSATGTRLFDRKWAVTIDTIKTTELAVKFKVEKTLKDKPNKCELHVYNLSEAHRKQLEELNQVTRKVSGLDKKKIRIAARKTATRGIPVQIEAGYADDNALSLLWLGDLRTVHSSREGPDWVTILESGDGEKAWQNARIHVSYGPKTPVETVIRAIVKELGLGPGNVNELTGRMSAAGGAILPYGGVISGPAAYRLRDWCRTCELEFSIQDGAIQLLEKGKAIAGRAIVVSEGTGMLGSPTVDVDGLLHVKQLMPAGVRPGLIIEVDAHDVSGNYKIEKCIWEGDSHGDSWTVEYEAQKFG